VTKDEISKYHEWREELITTAIRDYGYSHDVILGLAEGHISKRIS
jgi:hypothetical protein